jgi:DEAD/DEAH box helicase domain-containing protein
VNTIPRQRSLFESIAPTLVFDLETQRSFQEVGGRDQIHRLGLSLAVVYNYATEEYRTYRETDAAALIDDLLAAGRVIGFNVKGFDYLVLRPYRPETDLRTVPTLDLMEDLARVLGFRIGLDKVAGATLGKHKSADGLAALRWYKEGRFDLIEKYCRDDVEVTRLLYEYGRDHGEVRIPERDGSIRTVPVRWA